MGIKRILVTGSEGYIGTVLMSQLIEKGYQVIGLDTCYYSKPNSQVKPYPLIKKDIRKIQKKDLIHIDAIIHLAALSNDPLGEINPSITKDINYKATIKLATLAKKVGVKRFLFSSSCSIYGIAKNGVVNESSTVNPLTEYAKSKILSEKSLKKLADNTFCVGLLRNSTVYGSSPALRSDLVVNNLVLSALIHNNIKMLSDGTPWRPLIDVRDLANIFIEFLIVRKDKINGRIINIGFSENNLQVKEIAHIIHQQLTKTKISFNMNMASDSRSYKVDFSLFHRLFPFIKQYWPLKKSIKDLIKILNTNTLKQTYSPRLADLENLQKKGMLDSNLYWKVEVSKK